MDEPAADQVVLVCGNSGTYAHLPSESDPTSPRCSASTCRQWQPKPWRLVRGTYRDKLCSECFGDTDRGAREASECPVCGAAEVVSLANHLWAHCEDVPLGDDRR